MNLFEQTSKFRVDKDSVKTGSILAKDRKIVVQPYDFLVESIVRQVQEEILFLKPLSDRPEFQRNYVWTESQSSKLIESIIMNVPIPPCYLSQNDESEYDVIDGQQRIYTLYRFLLDKLKLIKLEVHPEFNNMVFSELPNKIQRRIKTHVLRCVVITNESHPEIKFDVFERLNTGNTPLTAQELRNCVFRGKLNNLLKELSFGEQWLQIRGRKKPDKRLADEELILRYFAFVLQDVKSHALPIQQRLNKTALDGNNLSKSKLEGLKTRWLESLEISLTWFEPNECFRRPGIKTMNRVVFDLVMYSSRHTTPKLAKKNRSRFRDNYAKIMKDEEFVDLINWSVDSRTRTQKRFDMWNEAMAEIKT